MKGKIHLVTRHFAFQDGLVAVETLAEVLHKTPKAIYDLKYRKVLPPAVRIGGRIYWIAEDIEAWVLASKEVVDA